MSYITLQRNIHMLPGSNFIINFGSYLYHLHISMEYYNLTLRLWLNYSTEPNHRIIFPNSPFELQNQGSLNKID